MMAAVGAFFSFLVLGDKGIYRMQRLLEMKHRLTEERDALNREIDRLTEEKAMLSDPANLEMTIRKELGYIRPGEVVFEEGTKADQDPAQKMPRRAKAKNR